MTQFFISYSRKDLEIAERIIQALAEDNMEPWLDWKSIPKGEDFVAEIERGIEDAKVFIFLVSPDSARSDWCNKEIDFAVKNGKRIIPIVIRDTDPKIIHPEIAKRNWIFYREKQDNFNLAIQDLKIVIGTDYEWMVFHTRLQSKALQWERFKDTSRLLRGKELREAEQRLVIGSNLDPQPTKLQREFVYASQSHENRLRRRAAILSVGNIVIILSMAIYIAYLSRQIALLKTSSLPEATPVLQTAIIPTNTFLPTPTKTQIPAATSTPLVVLVITPEAPANKPVSLLRQLYDENRNKTLFWLISILAGLSFTYIVGICSVLVIWWRKGGEFFSRSWLLKLAAKPLLITPGLGKWALFLGYKKRLMERSEINNATKNYFGLPAINPSGDDILPDEYGNNLHSAIADTLKPQQPIIVTGKGGAGKTTLLSRLTYLGLHDKLPVCLKGCRPILIPSEYYEGNLLDAITTVLRARYGVPLDRDMVQAQLEAGKFLVLFDGISEIKGEQSKGLDEILKFAQNSDYKNNRFVFTSRPNFAFPSGLPVFQLNPLTPDNVLRLLPRYSLGEERERQIHRQLDSFGSKPIEPLLLTMILAQEDTNKISSTRSQLYERYFRRLLRADNDLTWKGWSVILEEFAHWFLLDTGSRGVGILHEPLIDLMKESKSLAEKPKTLLERTQEYYDLPIKTELSILGILKSAGIIQETRQWRFAHDTFGEYFAAGYIISTFERTKTIPNLDCWKISDAQVNSFISVIEFINERLDEGSVKLLREKELPDPWKSVLNKGDTGD